MIVILCLCSHLALIQEREPIDPRPEEYPSAIIALCGELHSLANELNELTLSAESTIDGARTVHEKMVEMFMRSIGSVEPRTLDGVSSALKFRNDRYAIVDRLMALNEIIASQKAIQVFDEVVKRLGAPTVEQLMALWDEEFLREEPFLETPLWKSLEGQIEEGEIHPAGNAVGRYLLFAARTAMEEAEDGSIQVSSIRGDLIQRILEFGVEDSSPEKRSFVDSVLAPAIRPNMTGGRSLFCAPNHLFQDAWEAPIGFDENHVAYLESHHAKLSEAFKEIAGGYSEKFERLDSPEFAELNEFREIFDWVTHQLSRARAEYPRSYSSQFESVDQMTLYWKTRLELLSAADFLREASLELPELLAARSSHHLDKRLEDLLKGIDNGNAEAESEYQRLKREKYGDTRYLARFLAKQIGDVAASENSPIEFLDEIESSIAEELSFPGTAQNFARAIWEPTFQKDLAAGDYLSERLASFEEGEYRSTGAALAAINELARSSDPRRTELLHRLSEKLIDKENGRPELAEVLRGISQLREQDARQLASRVADLLRNDDDPHLVFGFANGLRNRLTLNPHETWINEIVSRVYQYPKSDPSLWKARWGDLRRWAEKIVEGQRG